MMYKAPRGTVDILPDKTIKWQMLEQLIRTICANYNVKDCLLYTSFEEKYSYV